MKQKNKTFVKIRTGTQRVLKSAKSDVLKFYRHKSIRAAWLDDPNLIINPYCVLMVLEENSHKYHYNMQLGIWGVREGRKGGVSLPLGAGHSPDRGWQIASPKKLWILSSRYH